MSSVVSSYRSHLYRRLLQPIRNNSFVGNLSKATLCNEALLPSMTTKFISQIIITSKQLYRTFFVKEKADAYITKRDIERQMCLVRLEL